MSLSSTQRASATGEVSKTPTNYTELLAEIELALPGFEKTKKMMGLLRTLRAENITVNQLIKTHPHSPISNALANIAPIITMCQSSPDGTYFMPNRDGVTVNIAEDENICRSAWIALLIDLASTPAPVVPTPSRAHH